MPRPDAYAGPALFSYGFRPFFLAASLFGLAVIPVWLMVWRGALVIGGPFTPVDWHVHEMVFGYAGAVIAGFLFTAVPNWTGRMPTRGWPLVLLAALWLAGRLAVAGQVPGLGPLGVALLDCAFLAAIAAMILREIVAGKNWRNLKVVVPVTLFLAANVVFHVEAWVQGGADIGRRLGLAVTLFLIMLIGGRIVPSFTRNWLSRQGATRMPVPFGRYDGACLAAGAGALAAWSLWPAAPASAALLVVAGVLHLVRLARWRGLATWRSPLLVMLHVAYAFVALGLLVAAAGAAGAMPAAAGLHLLGIGAIGGMTVAVMMRATRGHTGRSLEAGPVLTLAFAAIALAAPVRALLPGHWVGGVDGITLSAALWTLGFAALSLRLAPWLALPNPARRVPNRA